MAIETVAVVAAAAALIWSCRCGFQFLIEFFILNSHEVIQTFSHEFFIGARKQKVGNFASLLDTPTHAIPTESIEYV